MPSLTRSSKWFARVTVPHEFAKSTVNRVREWVDLESALIATHVGERNEGEHIHLVVSLTSNLQKQSFDSRLKQIYGVKGNANYSSKPWDGDSAACSYLFHDSKVEIILNKGYTQEDLDRFKQLNNDVQKVVAVNLERASTRHVDKVRQLMIDSARKWSRRDILEEFVERIRTGVMYDPGDFLLKRYIEELFIRQLDDTDVAAYVQDRYFNLYKS